MAAEAEKFGIAEAVKKGNEFIDQDVDFPMSWLTALAHDLDLKIDTASSPAAPTPGANPVESPGIGAPVNLKGEVESQGPDAAAHTIFTRGSNIPAKLEALAVVVPVSSKGADKTPQRSFPLVANQRDETQGTVGSLLKRTESQRPSGQEFRPNTPDAARSNGGDASPRAIPAKREAVPDQKKTWMERAAERGSHGKPTGTERPPKLKLYLGMQQSEPSVSRGDSNPNPLSQFTRNFHALTQSQHGTGGLSKKHR